MSDSMKQVMAYIKTIKRKRGIYGKDKDLNNDDIDVLLTEYNQCHNNYIYRDQLVVQEFNLAVIFIAALFGIIQTLREQIGDDGIIFVSLFGLLGLNILHVSLMTLESCKAAAIERALEIEHEIGCNNSKKVLHLVHDIGYRSIGPVERMLKRMGTITSSIVWFVRCLIFIWLAYSCVLIYGIYFNTCPSL